MTVLTRERALLEALLRIASCQPDPEGIAKAAIYAAAIRRQPKSKQG